MGPSTNEAIIYFIGAIVILLAVFLIIRELMLWYWKVNIIIKELQEIKKELMLARGVKSLEEEKIVTAKEAGETPLYMK